MIRDLVADALIGASGGVLLATLIAWALYRWTD